MVAWRTDVDSAQLMKCTVATEVEDADAEGRHQTQRTQDEMEIRKKKCSAGWRLSGTYYSSLLRCFHSILRVLRIQRPLNVGRCTNSNGFYCFVGPSTNEK